MMRNESGAVDTSVKINTDDGAGAQEKRKEADSYSIREDAAIHVDNIPDRAIPQEVQLGLKSSKPIQESTQPHSPPQQIVAEKPQQKPVKKPEEKEE
jgi:hypothetical protein